mmetsp:Transcript_78285/g.201554  ORF Transcript_78285/g.201554 Transcript_78285/m.201554 type:complete len:219 (+) Transcript_78285:2140-2796(+)
MRQLAFHGLLGRLVGLGVPEQLLRQALGVHPVAFGLVRVLAQGEVAVHAQIDFIAIGILHGGEVLDGSLLHLLEHRPHTVRRADGHDLGLEAGRRLAAEGAGTPMPEPVRLEPQRGHAMVQLDTDGGVLVAAPVEHNLAMLEATDLQTDLVADIEASVDRIMAKVTCVAEGRPQLADRGRLRATHLRVLAGHALLAPVVPGVAAGSAAGLVACSDLLE